ncbi:transposase [Actinomadura coerulea]|uniref:transposase n=1 Tax=Actinomadura coerulea TaxID=46159 RepID=UPI0034373E79
MSHARRADSLLIRSPRWARTAPAVPPRTDRSLEEHPAKTRACLELRPRPQQPTPILASRSHTSQHKTRGLFQKLVAWVIGFWDDLGAGRDDLSAAQWVALEPLLPVKKPGRPPKWTKRQLIDGIRFRVRTGVPWRDLPARYGRWQTVYGLFRRWQRDGTASADRDRSADAS